MSQNVKRYQLKLRKFFTKKKAGIRCVMKYLEFWLLRYQVQGLKNNAFKIS